MYMLFCATQIADESGAYLMADIAHISGLVAAGIGPSPFDYVCRAAQAIRKKPEKT